MGRRRVDLQTAAELLGISSDAVRKRAKRGTMAYETGADGRLYVWVDNGETDDYPAGEHGDQGGDRDTFVSSDPRDELVEELRDRVRALEEANRENRRIIAALTSRIPELEPPRDTPRDEPHASETATKEDPGTERPNDDTGEPRRSSWWRRFFGFSQ